MQDLAQLPKYEVCVPYTQAGSKTIRVLLRVSAGPAAAGAALREAVHALNPDLPLGEPQTLLAAKKQMGAPYEFVMGLLCSFAVAALLLAGAGLYGITSRAVAIRRREIGIRMALGADVGRVLRYVLRSALALVLTGTLLGSALAVVVIKLLITRIWWVSSVPVFFWIAPVALVMAVLAIISSLVPARRAARIDPSLCLKAE
ncbi:MAG: FtsX-like permease family protein [Acidobacteriota bacterium]